MGLHVPLQGAEFSGFLDDELGKLANITPSLLAELKGSKDPFLELQKRWNPVSLDILSDYLVNVALFSNPILVVDGWLILTEIWWEAFHDRSSFPLQAMIEGGLVSAFSRYEGVLHDLAEREAKKGIVTYQNVVNSPAYPKLKRALERLDQQSLHSYVPWPKFDMDKSIDLLLAGDLSVGIKGVFQESLEELCLGDRITPTQWDTLKQRYIANRLGEGLERKDSARQAWIRAITQSLTDFELTSAGVRELASIGVKAYHQSRALTLGVTYPDKDIRCSTLPTSILNAGMKEGALMSEEQFFDGVLSLSVSAKDLAAADKMEILKHFGRNGSELLRHKDSFILAREKWIANPVGETYNEYFEQAIAYASRLNPILSVPIRATGDRRFLERVPTAKVVREGLGAFVTGVAALSGPIAGGLAKVAHGTLGHSIENLPMLQGSVRLAVEKADFIERARRREAILDIHRQGPQAISPVQIDPSYAQSHTAALPTFE